MQTGYVDGVRLRKLRAERLINRAELSRRSGVSYRMLSLIETGRGGASDITAHKLAKALDVDVDALSPRSAGCVA